MTTLCWNKLQQIRRGSWQTMSLQDRMLLFGVTNDLKSLVAKRIFWKNSSLVFTFTTLPSVLLQLNYTFTSERPTLLLNEAFHFEELQAELLKD